MKKYKINDVSLRDNDEMFELQMLIYGLFSASRVVIRMKMAQNTDYSASEVSQAVIKEILLWDGEKLDDEHEKFINKTIEIYAEAGV